MNLPNCPFCGHGAHICQNKTDKYDAVTCCNMVGCVIGAKHLMFTKKQWNTRAEPPQAQSCTEKDKFIAYIQWKSKTGLKNIQFITTHESLRGRTEEEFYGELNRMLEAPDQPDVEVLGKYSPQTQPKQLSENPTKP